MTSYHRSFGSRAPDQPLYHDLIPPETGLSAKGHVLASLLIETLAEFQPQTGGSGEEVEVYVETKDILAVCRKAKEDPILAFNYLRCLSAVDYEEFLEVVYHLYSFEHGYKAVIKTKLPTDQPRLHSVVPVWRGANWYEREAHDLFGVVFDGHPNLAPLLLYEGFEGYPGLKSYPFPEYAEG